MHWDVTAKVRLKYIWRSCLDKWVENQEGMCQKERKNPQVLLHKSKGQEDLWSKPEAQHSFRSRDQGNLSSDPSGTYPSLYTWPKRELIICWLVSICDRKHTATVPRRRKLGEPILPGGWGKGDGLWKKNPLTPDLASDVSPNNQWDPETSQSSMTDSGSSDHSKSPKVCIRGLQRLTDLICEGPPAQQ